MSTVPTTQTADSTVWSPFVPIKTLPSPKLTPFLFNQLIYTSRKLRTTLMGMNCLTQTSKKIVEMVEEFQREMQKHYPREAEVEISNIHRSVEYFSTRNNNFNRDFGEEDEDELAVDESTIVRNIPMIISMFLKINRRCNMLCLSQSEITEETDNCINLMTCFAALELFDDIFIKTRALIKFFQDIELPQSARAADLASSDNSLARKRDEMLLVQQIKENLEKLSVVEQGTDFLDFEALGLYDTLMELQNDITDGLEETKQPRKILEEIREGLKAILPPIADYSDHLIADTTAELAHDQEPILYKFNNQRLRKIQQFLKGEVRGEAVFLKPLFDRQQLSARSRRELQVEIELLHRVGGHPNVLQFYGGTFLDGGGLFLCWQQHKMSLYELLFVEEHSWKYGTLIRFAADILSGLNYLHNQNFVHSDLTTDNVFLELGRPDGEDVAEDAQQYHLVVGNFAFVEQKREERKKWKAEQPGDTANLYDFGKTYSAPETYRTGDNYVGQVMTFGSDIYSFGIIFWELLERQKAFAGCSLEDLKKKILSRNSKRPNWSQATRVPQVIKDMVNSAWQQGVWLRPSASSLKKDIIGFLSFYAGSGNQGFQELSKSIYAAGGSQEDVLNERESWRAIRNWLKTDSEA
eukprot:snap_masked-scaffold_10-processed-gene-9.9-mRNA-1 protein AED:1.00 eAED:1.00 QI:0/-1/0/0/-1/1/1/0/637